MRTLLLLLIGLLAGAAAFHAYYLRLAPPDRCGWDHPFDRDGAAACRVTREADARRQLDSLIDTINR